MAESKHSPELEATLLRNGRYAVHPRGALGTCGFFPYPWSVAYVNANSEEHAIRKALRIPYVRAEIAKAGG